MNEGLAEELEIARLGAQGDGIADLPAGPRFAPFALPGERVRIENDGSVSLVSAASADRVRPLCRHFGTCGGCVAQHMGDRLYADWKHDVAVEAFRRRGLAPPVAPLQRVPVASRRRAVLTTQRAHGRAVVLGYHRRRSNDLIDIEECPVLQPAIADRLATLRTIAAALPGPETRLTVLATLGGLDISAETGTDPAGKMAAAELAQLAAGARLARLTVNGETIVEQARPALSFAGVAVVPPPGAFVQAVEAAEMAMARLVTDAVGKAKRVADLFCGAGTFALPMARRSRVLAVDSSPAALAALGAAARQAQGLKPIETKQRDLFREPLSAKELEAFDAVVFDPPRAGAADQAERLAQSRVPTVVAVSCDPATLARDVRVLVDGGYQVEAVTPIDQFLFSAHIEAVAVLRR